MTSESARELVAVFGGSFNPPHIAHVMTVLVVLSTHPVDRVVVIPTFAHPFAKQLAPYEDRVRMIELAMAGIARVEISRIEETLGGESRTLRTLEHLQSEHPSWNLRLVMGADVLAETPKWYAFDRIAKIAPPIVLGRAGFESSAAPTPILPAISSTDIRAKVGQGRWSDLEPIVPRTVLEYIREHALYEHGH
ncbi:nicotinate (nicotinamide) nucleotide adenylyltransferase [Pendulispora brunnea]|uniref:Probable nicotinate-nucleotide adenylyltransferase n=1 Tax=Pendulispora brunnea TaxID=2905690 RepID=A0ABZ2K7D6_9BACT